MFGHPLVDTCPVNEGTGVLLPVVTIVTDKGGPFRSLNFELFIMGHPELRHVRTRARKPRQNGSRERGVGTLKVRAPVPRRHPRRPHTRRASRGLPHRIQHRAPSQSHRLEPAPRNPPRARRPRHPPPSNKKKLCQLLDAGHHHTPALSQAPSPKSSMNVPEQPWDGSPHAKHTNAYSLLLPLDTKSRRSALAEASRSTTTSGGGVASRGCPLASRCTLVEPATEGVSEHIR